MISKSLVETAEFARNFLKQLAKGARSGAMVVALYGDLGSGKTTFTQFLAKELGVENYVTSPTFVIEKKYVIPAQAGIQGFKTLIHIDCYRLTAPDEMLHLGWSEIAADPNNLIVVEWPERIASILPNDCVKIEFKFVGENEREILVKS